jgi:hypothetical protein
VKRKQTAKLIGKKMTRKGEVWRISSGGKIKNLATRAASTKAMDEAMIVYGGALRRLADR